MGSISIQEEEIEDIANYNICYMEKASNLQATGKIMRDQLKTVMLINSAKNVEKQNNKAVIAGVISYNGFVVEFAMAVLAKMLIVIVINWVKQVQKVCKMKSSFLIRVGYT